ncbi:MAG: agmatinase family protein [Marinicaulis sp.]|nr:agmatinase family protein [Marinicaulis sp.]
MPVSLVGFPWDASSSYARGAALAPYIIRAVLTSEASSPYSFSGQSFRDLIVSYDFGELPNNPEPARKAIYKKVTDIVSSGNAPLSLGGDHSITFPILDALKDKYGALNVLHIDAHTDLYDEFGGDRYSHASPFARALENGCVNNLIQIGLRSVGPEQRKFGAANGVIMLGAESVGAIPFDRLVAPLYISIDLDGIDPAFAPGVSHQEPGGLTVREVLSILSKLNATPIGADIVEYNPEFDRGLQTAHVCARLAKELTDLMSPIPSG